MNRRSLPREQRRQNRVAYLQGDKHARKVSHRFVNQARDFLKRIGLPFKIVPSYQPDPPNSFFKGCWIDRGTLYFCPARVQVGELLHEAGHLALLPRHRWQSVCPGTLPDDFDPPLGQLIVVGDAAVEAWDYAAALAADIPGLAVFQNGFNGAGFHVWEAFDSRHHPGFALLRLLGLSSQWGTCDRWLVREQDAISEDLSIDELLKDFSKKEQQGLLAFLKQQLEGGCNA